MTCSSCDFRKAEVEALQKELNLLEKERKSKRIMSRETTVYFSFTHLAVTYEVQATLSQFEPEVDPSVATTGYEGEWIIQDIEVIGPEGDCWYGEMREYFTRGKSGTVTVAQTVVDMAMDEVIK